MTAMFRIHRKEAYQNETPGPPRLLDLPFSSSCALGAVPEVPYKAAGDAGLVDLSLLSE
jgi:hypothetical protein